MSPASRPPLERFWEKVDITDTCWVWTAAIVKRTTGTGSGKFWDGEKFVQSHRFSYEDLVGPIPEGLQIDHLCFNPRCVNPDHLEPVTGEVNRQRSYDRTTHCPQGHEYTPANTYVRTRGNGKRQCRACHNEEMKRRRRNDQ